MGTNLPKIKWYPQISNKILPQIMCEYLSVETLIVDQCQRIIFLVVNHVFWRNQWDKEEGGANKMKYGEFWRRVGNMEDKGSRKGNKLT